MPSTELQHWQAMLDRIKQNVRPQQFTTWFSNLRPFRCDSEHITIRVPNAFFKEWLEGNYKQVISRAARAVLDSAPLIEFEVDRSLSSAVDSEATVSSLAGPRTTSTRGNELRLNDSYTFDNFVVGPSNRLAHAASLAVSNNPGTVYNPLFVHGSVGLGKSHLLQAICHAAMGNGNPLTLRYLSCEAFVNDFISAIQNGWLEGFRRRYRELDILVLDDIQFLAKAERTQEEFFHTFNSLYNAQKQIILSSDCTPSELPGLQERLISRFKGGLIVRIDAPSFETRLAILQKKAAVRGLRLPPDVQEYIAQTVTSNIRELEGAIVKVIGYASLSNTVPSLELAKSALREPAGPNQMVTIDDVLRAVAERFNLRVADLQSKRRTKSVAYPRHICMHLARRLTSLSLSEIGGYFGGRDHSTVIYADKKILSGARKDPELLSTLEEIVNTIKSHG